MINNYFRGISYFFSITTLLFANDQLQKKAENILNQLSKEEKISLLSGKGVYNTQNIDRVGQSHLAILAYDKANDPREKIFSYAVKSNWIITEMTPQSAGLESIFRTLTMGDGSND